MEKEPVDYDQKEEKGGRYFSIRLPMGEPCPVNVKLYPFTFSAGIHLMGIFVLLMSFCVKSILSISLALVILLNSMSRVWIVMGYQLNKEYIARVLCINKDKPKLGCNGKCHLKKQLQKAAEQEKKTGNRSEGKSESLWLCSTYAFLISVSLFTQEPENNSPYQPSVSLAPQLGIFQPPRV